MSVNLGVGENLLSKADMLDEVAKPYSARITAIAQNSTKAINGNDLGSAIITALPENMDSYAKSDQAFLNGIIEEVRRTNSVKSAHHLRQRLAEEVNAYGAKNYPNGVPPKLTMAVNDVREAIGKTIDAVEPEYGEARRAIAPVLSAKDELWKVLGGKWRTFDGDSKGVRAAQLTRRLSGNSNPDLWRALEITDDVLGKNGRSVGGDVLRQSGAARIVENMFSAARPGSFQSEVQQGTLNAMDIANLASPKGAVGTVAKVTRSLLAPNAAKVQERAMMNVQNAFADYVTAVAQSRTVRR
jgi:hypothetical protein